jgi:hypothetical protein
MSEELSTRRIMTQNDQRYIAMYRVINYSRVVKGQAKALLALSRYWVVCAVDAVGSLSRLIFPTSANPYGQSSAVGVRGIKS